MPCLPRLAVGTVEAGAPGTAVIWALLDRLERAGLSVQCFLSQACFRPVEGAPAITGLGVRHLDSWMMSRDTCRAVFLRGASFSDVAFVEGSFASPSDFSGPGGSLATLCDWLVLPSLAVVDARCGRHC